MRVGLRLGARERGRRLRRRADRRDMDDAPDARRSAGIEQRAGALDLHRLHVVARAVLQHADAVHDRVDVGKQRPPGVGGRQPREVGARSIAHREIAAAPRRSSGRRRSAHGRRDAGAPGSRSRSGRRLRSPERACRAVTIRKLRTGCRRPGRACRRPGGRRLARARRRARRAEIVAASGAEIVGAAAAARRGRRASSAPN